MPNIQRNWTQHDFQRVGAAAMMIQLTIKLIIIKSKTYAVNYFPYKHIYDMLINN